MQFLNYENISMSVMYFMFVFHQVVSTELEEATECHKVTPQICKAEELMHV